MRVYVQLCSVAPISYGSPITDDGTANASLAQTSRKAHASRKPCTSLPRTKKTYRASPRRQTLGQATTNTTVYYVVLSYINVYGRVFLLNSNAYSRKQILAQADDRASLAQANLAQASRKQILVAGFIS